MQILTQENLLLGSIVNFFLFNYSQNFLFLGIMVFHATLENISNDSSFKISNIVTNISLSIKKLFVIWITKQTFVRHLEEKLLRDTNPNTKCPILLHLQKYSFFFLELKYSANPKEEAQGPNYHNTTIKKVKNSKTCLTPFGMLQQNTTSWQLLNNRGTFLMVQDVRKHWLLFILLFNITVVLISSTWLLWRWLIYINLHIKQLLGHALILSQISFSHFSQYE